MFKRPHNLTVMITMAREPSPYCWFFEPLQVADEMYFIGKGEVSVLVSNGKCARVTVGFKDPRSAVQLVSGYTLYKLYQIYVSSMSN